MLVDTHAHLNFPDFKEDLETVVNESINNGVTKIICASSNLEDSKKSIEIAKKYPKTVFASIGIHPQKTDPKNLDSINEQINQLKELAKNPEVLAIGECGLDFSPAPPEEENRSKEDQKLLFRKQIEIAIEFSLPIIVHSRKSLEETLQILGEYQDQNLKGMIHCYSGGKSDIKKVEELGFYFGLDGNLTYDLGLQNVAREIPLEKILLETDSPFLTPEPLRGLRNTPANVKIIAEFLAKLKGAKVEEIERITLQNAQKIFKI